MAKAGFIMQGGKGKIGNVVLYKGEKGTLQRELVAPRNAKTAKQMAQRIIFATVTQAAAFLKSLVNHSFENIPEGDKSVREFVRLNLNLLRQYAADDYANTPTAENAKVFVTTKGISTLIPNRYVVSRGTLLYDGVIGFKSSGPSSGLVGFTKQWATEGTLTAISVEDNQAEITFKAMDILSLFGIHTVNDQLSFAYIGTDQDNKLFDYDGENTPGFVITSGRSRVVRLVPRADITENTEWKVSATTSTPYKESLSTRDFEKLFDLDKTDLDFLRYVSQMLIESMEAGEITPNDHVGDVVTFEQEEDEIVYSDTWDSTDSAYLGSDFRSIMGGLIRSQYDPNNNKWRRSTCVLEGAGPNTDINYGLIWSIANAAWNKGSQIAADGLFLDQGGEGGSIAG